MNNITTWKESLQTIFTELPQPEDINPDTFYNKLNEIMPGISNSFNNLNLEQKKKFILDLYELSKPAGQEWQDLYTRIADNYEAFFEWEEDSTPGWLF